MRMDAEFGNAGDTDTRGTGWFVGFSDWVRESASSDLRHVPGGSLLEGLSVKWMHHPAGDGRGLDKPVSQGRTLSILVSPAGRFRIQLSRHPDFPAGAIVEHVLQRHGDFSVWGAGIHHRWFVDADSIVLTIRWAPVERGVAASVSAA
jgi:hypothetical protein